MSDDTAAAGTKVNMYTTTHNNNNNDQAVGTKAEHNEAERESIC